MMNLQDLISRAKEVTASGLPFMEGKEKAELSMGEILNIDNYGYLEGEQGEFVVFTTKEYKDKFFFGSTVLTSKMKELDEVFKDDEMAKLLENGIEVVFEEKRSRNKRDYKNVTFFPSQK